MIRELDPLTIIEHYVGQTAVTVVEKGGLFNINNNCDFNVLKTRNSRKVSLYLANKYNIININK